MCEICKVEIPIDERILETKYGTWDGKKRVVICGLCITKVANQFTKKELEEIRDRLLISVI